MRNDDQLLLVAKKQIEEKLGWGNSVDWTNRDFIELSKKIFDEIEISISHVTLKRVWGKIKYDSLPNNYTLSTLVQFIGYENWRDFSVKNNVALSDNRGDDTALKIEDQKFSAATKPQMNWLGTASIFVAVTIIAFFAFRFITSKTNQVHPGDYSFSYKKVLAEGIPNSVIFDFDASHAPSDSVIIQQSWDTSLRVKVSRDQRQHTLIYYFPGFFIPKLIVNNHIVKEDHLLLKSAGWLTAVGLSPMPVYFGKEDVMINGKMALSVDKMKEQNINLGPQAPNVSYINVQDFGEIYSDNFVFETALKNDYKEGSSVCQLTHIYLLCEATAVGIPLCAKGCESSLDFFFTNFSVSGKQHDLSCFGVNFSQFVKVKVEAVNGKAQIYLNDKLAYKVDHDIIKSKIIGIDFVFQGTGSVDSVTLSNNKVFFHDDFN